MRTRKPARSKVDQRDQLPELGRLREYRIEGLFGRAKFSFDLDPHEPTLLTGVNGTGKSTILRTIDAISSTQWSSLAGLPFRKIVLNFEKSDIEVDKFSDELEIIVRADGFDPWTYVADKRFRRLQTRLSNESWHTHLFENLEEIEQLTIDIPMGEGKAEALLSLVGESSLHNIPEWVKSIRERFPVLFVTDQRLVVDSPGSQRIGESRTAEKVPTRVAVDEAAQDIFQRIQQAKSTYATVAQELDSDFPQRVIKAMSGKQASVQSLRAGLASLTRLRKALEATRLLAAEEASVSFAQLELEDPSVLAVIDTYVKDTNQKLATLEGLRRRLQLFTDFLNQHYVSKRVVIDQENGFRIRVDGATDNLPPARLSSGEQQILVLAHRILFRAKPRTLVLIDEPELSLHVVWQSTFVDDLARMGEVDHLSFLLATHSPTLIHGREDLKRSLDV